MEMPSFFMVLCGEQKSCPACSQAIESWKREELLSGTGQLCLSLQVAVISAVNRSIVVFGEIINDLLAKFAIIVLIDEITIIEKMCMPKSINLPPCYDLGNISKRRNSRDPRHLVMIYYIQYLPL